MLADEAAGSGATEALLSHPPNPELSEQLFSRVGYVARRHTTENDAGGLFQQPSSPHSS
jgi:hypothetical protein